MTPYPDSDPAAAPRPDGPGGDQDALESSQVPDVTSPEASTQPTEEKPSDQPGGTPPSSADANGAAAAAGNLLELALSELQGRRAGLLAEIAALEQQRDRIRQEIGAQAIGQSEWIANRVKGFQAYLVGALQDLAAAAEQAELVVAPVVVQPSPLDRTAAAAEAVAAPAVAGQFSQDEALIRGALVRYGGQPDFYADPWKLRRTLEPAGAALLEDWFLNQGGRGAQPSGGSRNRNVLVAASAIAILGELYGDRFQTLVLAGQPERLGEWRRGLQDCLGLGREDFGPTSGIVLFERAEALVERADRLEERGELPFIVVDAGEAALAVPVLQFPLWLAFAATPGEIASEEDLY
jgi:hypothetical protein